MKKLPFTDTILTWYDQNKRDLPWRNTHDPYVIWVSEIILQQTRVGQGLDYFLNFIDHFPTVTELARSDEQEVLKAWQGLGYYTRARNLHAAAKDLVANHNGIFPDSYEKIVRLKGIGPYTAAAIASIAFGLPCPVVDGNVIRFFSRYFGIGEPVGSSTGKKKIHDHAVSLIDRKKPGIFNQAVMEFGALQCRPRKPDCSICPLWKNCRAFLDIRVEELPVKKKSKKQRERYFHYIVIIKEDRKKKKFVYLRKREEQDIWKNLFDFPLIEADHMMETEKFLSSAELAGIMGRIKAHIVSSTRLFRHVLSHQVIMARFFIFRQDAVSGARMPYHLIPADDLHNYPFPRLIDEFFKNDMVGL